MVRYYFVLSMDEAELDHAAACSHWRRTIVRLVLGSIALVAPFFAAIKVLDTPNASPLPPRVLPPHPALP